MRTEAMLIEKRGRRPSVHPSATVAPSAIVQGDVTIAEGTVVSAGAVIAAEGAPVRIGARCVILEHAVIRGAGVHPCVLGDHVLVGPHAHVSGASVERCCFVATGAVVLNGARLGEGTVVAIHGVVHIDTACAPDTFVPIGHVATGSPAIVHEPARIQEAHRWVREHGFTRTVFGFDSSEMSNAEATRLACDRYSAALAHERDEPPIR